mgnify:CR=1 FL=1
MKLYFAGPLFSDAEKMFNAFPGAKLNPMIRMPFDGIFENERELMEYMRALC